MGQILANIIIIFIGINIFIWGIGAIIYSGNTDLFTYLECVGIVFLTLLILFGIIGVVSLIVFILTGLYGILLAF